VAGFPAGDFEVEHRRLKTDGHLLFLSSFLSFPLPLPSLRKSAIQRELRHGGRERGGGAATVPLADARVHPRVSAPPSSGSVVVPLAQTARWRRADECMARPVCPLGARLCDAGDGGGGAEVRPKCRHPPALFDLDLGLGFRDEFLVAFLIR
jgi:hypothetical protein